MRFDEFATEEASGTVLAHSMRLGGVMLKKGRILSPEDIAALKAAGIATVTVARLDFDDVAEDEAARRVAAACRGDHVEIGAAFTGRTNLMSAAHGLAVIDRETLIALNLLDEGLTVATLAPFAVVERGQMVATVKIIPFALPRATVTAAEALLATRPPIIAVAPFAAKTAGLVLTRVPGTKASLIEKRIGAISTRLDQFGSRLGSDETVAHDTAAVALAVARQAAQGLDPILVFGASAIVDRGDVVPAAVRAAGGEVVHVGMPVDPGNLLMVGRIGGADVIGVPSCATSVKLNGFDWVLARALANLPVRRAEIVAMAPGGLLTEIEARPQPRGG